jgi:hypothetical protein
VAAAGIVENDVDQAGCRDASAKRHQQRDRVSASTAGTSFVRVESFLTIFWNRLII